MSLKIFADWIVSLESEANTPLTLERLKVALDGETLCKRSVILMHISPKNHMKSVLLLIV